MQRISDMRGTVELWRDVETEAGDLRELFGLAQDEGDEALVSEVGASAQTLEKRLGKLEFQLLLSGKYDRSSAMLAVHAGAGGTESQDWAEMLLRMFMRWAERREYKVRLLDSTQGEEAGLKSATIEISGSFAYGYLKSERGVHRLVRISPFDASHGRHTSFALVEVMPEVEAGAVEIDINPDDLRIDVFRSSGAGGQSVQKNSTAVRITHLPTGFVAVCQNERSQFQNREMAMKILESKLIEAELERRAEEQAKLKGEHVAAGWGNQIRSYVLHPYKMVKDHRTDHETSNAPAVLEGEIDEFIEAYLKSTMGNQATEVDA